MIKKSLNQNDISWNAIELLHNFMAIVELFVSKLDKQYKPENLNY